MSDELTWELLHEVYGRMEADLLQTYLEAEGIPVQMIQEGAGRSVYPVTFGPLALVQLFVPKEKLAAAKSLLKNYLDNQTTIGTDEDGDQDSGE
jgi:hypothetical protein